MILALVPVAAFALAMLVCFSIRWPFLAPLFAALALAVGLCYAAAVGRVLTATLCGVDSALLALMAIDVYRATPAPYEVPEP